MIDRILCRLGLHSWKPVMQYGMAINSGASLWCWYQTACQCRRCGKRVRL